MTDREEILPGFHGVSGMTRLQLVKVQPQVFTAKCSEPQVENSNVGMKEGASKTSEPTYRNPIEAKWWMRLPDKPKSER